MIGRRGFLKLLAAAPLAALAPYRPPATFTLLEWARATESAPRMASIIQLLSQTNDLLAEMDWVETRTPRHLDAMPAIAFRDRDGRPLLLPDIDILDLDEKD